MLQSKLLVVLAATALVFTSGLVLHAQPAGGEQGADFFDRLDVNQDGQIDADEFRGPAEAFARMDANGDGAIARDELNAEVGRAAGRRGQNAARGGDADPARRWEQMLERFDANNDGEISAEEIQGRQEVLRFLDANNDNVITEDEAMAAGNRRGQGAQMDPAQRWQQLIDNCDANDDGKVSADEWPARPEGFARLDRDGDGFLVQDEVAQLRRQQAPEAGRAALDPAQMFMQMMDENGDGQVSDEEWGNFFVATDVNADGMIAHAELFAKIQASRRPPQDALPVEEPAAPEEGF